MRKIRALAVAVALAAPISLGTINAAPASAVNFEPKCQTWNDQNTYGVYCSTGGMQNYDLFRAQATCTTGKIEARNYEWVGNGRWSYAYCSSIGGHLQVGSYYLDYS
nr:hypothetical protein [Streptomyces sp. TLI_235]